MKKIFFTMTFFLWTCSSPTKSDNPPVASFSASQLSGIEPLVVQFQSTSTGDITSYNWNFGNGTTSTLENPQVTFNEGTFTIILNTTGPDGSSSKLVQDMITVSSSAPISEDINVLLDEDNQASITLISSDPKDKSLVFSIADNPSNGSISLSENLVTYTPDDHFNGQDSFTYRTFNGEKYSNTALVNISINPIDDDPYTNDIDITIDEDNSIQIALSADEYDGDSIYFQINSNPSHGSASLSNNTVNYTPNENYYGNDTFTYEAFDTNSRKKLNEGTVSITINPVNDPPTQIDDINFYADFSKTLYYTIEVEDIDGDELTFSLGTNPWMGTANFDGNTLIYSHDGSGIGDDYFTILVSDSNGGSISFLITLDVIGSRDSKSLIQKNSTKMIPIFNVRNDETPSSLVITSQPQNGTATIENDSIKYIPNFNFVGIDSVSYASFDGTYYTHNTKLTIESNIKLSSDLGTNTGALLLNDSEIIIKYDKPKIVTGNESRLKRMDFDNNVSWDILIDGNFNYIQKLKDNIVVSGSDILIFDINGNLTHSQSGDYANRLIVNENEEYYYVHEPYECTSNGETCDRFIKYNSETFNSEETFEVDFDNDPGFGSRVKMIYADSESYYFIYRNERFVKTNLELEPIWAFNGAYGFSDYSIKKSSGNEFTFCGKYGNGVGVIKFDSDGNILIPPTEIMNNYGIYSYVNTIPFIVEDNGDMIIMYQDNFIVKFDANLNEIANSKDKGYYNYIPHANRSAYSYYQFEGSPNYSHREVTYFLLKNSLNELIFGGNSRKAIGWGDFSDRVNTLFKSKVFD